MITRYANLTGRLAVLFAFLFTISACGGGGGGNGGFLPDDNGDGPTSNIKLSLTDFAGEATDTVTATAPVILTARVTRDGGKKPVANTLVSAEILGSDGNPSEIATLLPEDGTALTDSQGEARFQITAVGGHGAATVVVFAGNIDDPNVSIATLAFRVGQAGLRLGHFENGSFVDGQIGLTETDLSAGGSVLLTMNVVDENGAPVRTVEEIFLSSGCSQAGLATLPASVNTVNGQATAGYTANGCGGTDQITATLASSGAVATGVVNLAAAEADVIQFVSANPRTIAIRGTGSSSRPEKSTVIFRVIAGTGTEEDPGTPLSGMQVNFSLSTEVGGVSLQNQTGFTDSSGQVSTVVRSGTAATTSSPPQTPSRSPPGCRTRTQSASPVPHSSLKGPPITTASSPA
jgi:hypothetical protein